MLLKFKIISMRIRWEYSPMAWETWVQSQVESYRRLKKWHLMPPCLTLRIIRYGSRVKWSNPGKGVVPSPTPWCSSYWKGSLRVTFDYGRQLSMRIGQVIRLQIIMNFSETPSTFPIISKFLKHPLSRLLLYSRKHLFTKFSLT